MILLRSIREDDLEGLRRLARIPGFINLMDDADFLKEKISRSRASFSDTIKDKASAKYVFVAEDLKTREILGTSMIAAQHGSTESPHFYFEVSQEEKFSETINTGFIHGTLKLKYDTNGPSEIGGLVVDPATRNQDARVGRQISFARFLFLALHKNRFKRKVLAELLPPLNQQGQSPLWEAIGRRFTSMDYWEADQLCQKNKEFIFSLFPTGKIYTTFLTAEARNAIGKVGRETEPVMHMLKKIGFVYKSQIDPFDGGPHLWAGVDDILPVKRTASYVLEAAEPGSAETPASGLLTAQSPGKAAGDFRAIAVDAVTRDGKVRLAPGYSDAPSALGISAGETVSFMPYY